MSDPCVEDHAGIRWDSSVGEKYGRIYRRKPGRRDDART